MVHIILCSTLIFSLALIDIPVRRDVLSSDQWFKVRDSPEDQNRTLKVPLLQGCIKIWD